MQQTEKLDLQLFATNTQTTALTATGNNLSSEMKTFYEKVLLEDTKPNLVYGQFGQEKPIPKNGGKSVEWRKFSSLPKALTPITEGVTPDGSKLNVTAITGTVNQYGAYVMQSDMLELTAIDNTILEATKLLGNQAGLTLDTIYREGLMAGTNVQYADKVTTTTNTTTGITNETVTAITSRADLTATCKLTPDVIMQAVRQLKRQNIDTINGNYVGIIHPDVAYDLMRNEEWIESHKYATPENMYNGEIGKIGGVRFVETSEAKIWKDDTCPTGLAVYGVLLLGANAYGKTSITGGGLQHIVKQKGSAGTGDPLDQRSSVGWKAIAGVKILNDAAMLRIECCSKFSSTATAN